MVALQASRCAKISLVLLLATVLLPMTSTASDEAEDGVSRVDHLVFAGPDLDEAILYVENLFGIRASPGGSHPGGGTRNALIALGPSSYLEIIGPDPAQTEFDGERLFGIDRLDAPALVGWAASGHDIERIASIDIGTGETPGASRAGSRRRTDGLLLRWQFTDPAVTLFDGVVPFFIDWGETPHPATSAVGGASLVSLRAEHPDADGVRAAFAALGLDIAVTQASGAALFATIETPRGRVELR